MKLNPRFAICAGAVLAVVVCSAQTSRPVAYESFKAGKAYFHSILVDIHSPMVSAETVHSPKLTSVWNLVKPSTPVAGITGTFFAPSCGRPVADVLVDGNLVAKGERGSVLAVDWVGNVKIFDARFRQKLNYQPYRFALRGAVRLVTNGAVMPNPKAQKFRDKRIWGRAARTAVGITKAGKVLLVATKSAVTLSELGKAMRQRGVMNAISLDGGSSTCLYYRGSFVLKPGRKLSNLFVIRERPSLNPMNSVAQLGGW